ncbi:hypothetical protein KIH74_04300 [Kineosporia sp. J2-2]|uniref:Uncharacterized protein n=1 Tax=Kineosporia corallincola TaxID=2835133 RepID=A0ABS5TEU7_9ACTN|nr:hypothetical protein [Kineosporia corallincola]MBT0768129.1 hypothetical protein [Kineosporia corallincola]
MGAQRVEVDLASLTTFAHSVAKLADSNSDAALSDPKELINNVKVAATFNGAGGFHEAATFSAYHTRLAGSVSMLLGEAIQGLTSLGFGAEVCALNYAGSDQRNAALQKLAQAAAEDNHDLADLTPGLKGKSQIPASAVDDAFTPSKEEKDAEKKSDEPKQTKKETPSPGLSDEQWDKIIEEKDAHAGPGVTDMTSQAWDGTTDYEVEIGEGKSVTIPADDPSGSFKYEKPYRPGSGS